MKEKNMIILIVAAVLLGALLTFISFGLTSQETNNTTNDTINITLNESNTTNNNTTSNTTPQKKKTTPSNNKKSNQPKIVDESVDYNYQVDDGSYIRTVEYSDGSIKQYDMEGNRISPGDMS